MFLDALNALTATVMARLPALLAAVAVLFFGWLIARIAARLVGRLVARLTRATPVQGLAEAQEKYRVDRTVTQVVYWLLMLLVLVAFFDVLGVGSVMQPFLLMLNELTLAIPNLVKAVLILLAAWVLATLLRVVAVRTLGSGPAGSALQRLGVVEDEAGRGRLVSTAGNLGYYLVLVLFLPAILGALQLQGLMGPVEQVIAQALAFLPRLAAALVTVLIGYVVARVVRGIVAQFLASAGVDQLPEKAGMGEVFRQTPLSRALAAVVFALILVPVAISALESLGVAAISDPAVSMLTVVLEMVPSVAAAILLLAAGIALARWVGQLTASLLESIGLGRFLAKWGLLKDAETTPPVHAVIGNVISGVVVLLITVEVFEILRLGELSAITRDILGFLPQLAVAIVILAVGWAVGGFADRSLRAVLQGTQYPLWLGGLARYAVLVLVAMMALEQVGVARAIVVNAFSIILGAAGLAMAIAVGLGAKDTVQRWLDQRLR